MKHYDSKELDAKINTFLSRKFEKYPELADQRRNVPVVSKPSFTTRMVQSLVA